MIYESDYDSKSVEELQHANVEDVNYEAVAKAIRNAEAKIEAIKTEKLKLTEMQNACDEKIEWLKKLAIRALQESNQSKTEAGIFTLALRKSTVCCVYEDTMHDERFIKTEVITKIDKMGIKDALKAGEVIEGAELIENVGLNIK